MNEKEDKLLEQLCEKLMNPELAGKWQYSIGINQSCYFKIELDGFVGGINCRTEVTVQQNKTGQVYFEVLSPINTTITPTSIYSMTDKKSVSKLYDTLKDRRESTEKQKAEKKVEEEEKRKCDLLEQLLTSL